MDETSQASHWGLGRRPFEKTSLTMYASTSSPSMGKSFNVISSETTGMVVVVPSSYDTRQEMMMMSKKKESDVARSSIATNECEEFVSFSSAVGSEFDFSATFSEVDGAPWSPPPMSSAEELFHNGRIRPLGDFPAAQLEQTSATQPPLSRSDDGYFDFRSSANYASFSAPQSPPSSSPKQMQRKQRYGDARPPIETTLPALEEWKKSHEFRRKSSGENMHRIETRRHLREGVACRRSRSLSPLRVFHMDDQQMQPIDGDDFLPSPISDAHKQRSVQEPRKPRRGKTLQELIDGSDCGEFRWRGIKSAEKSSEKKSKGAPSLHRRASMPNNKTGALSSSPKHQPLSPHEIHYTSQRAQADQLKRKTSLPYRHGILGCLGFPSKSYRSVSGINPLNIKT